MIWTFLIILWILFLTMFFVGVLSVRQGTQVLGVRFLPEHRYAPEIKAVVRRFAIGMAAVFVVLAAVSLILRAAGFAFRLPKKPFCGCEKRKGGRRPLKRT